MKVYIEKTNTKRMMNLSNPRMINEKPEKGLEEPCLGILIWKRNQKVVPIVPPLPEGQLEGKNKLIAESLEDEIYR